MIKTGLKKQVQI